MKNKRTKLEHGAQGYQIRGGSFSEKVFTLGSTDFCDTITGGAQFDDCEFRMKGVGKTDFNFGATCVNCDFILPKRVANRYMDAPVLEACRFHGHFVGFDFGPKFLDRYLLGPSRGSLRNCDFSAARLHHCAFYETSPNDHILPDWPHIHLDFTDGIAWAGKLAEAPFPARLKMSFRMQAEPLPADSSVRQIQFLSIYLPELDCDPEAIWPLIQDVPQIFFPSKATKARADTEDVAAVGEDNLRAAAEAKREQERLAIFNLMHRSWLLESKVVEGSQSAIDLLFDTSALRKRVQDAPLQVRIRLEDGKVSLRMGDVVRPLEGLVEKFMSMSAVLEGDTVVLKPHRKERGQVLINFNQYTAFDDAGKPLETSKMSEYVNRYWRSEI